MTYSMICGLTPHASRRLLLSISGQKPNAEDVQYLHRGIAGRSFQRRFELADYVKVVSAGLVNGLLTIDLKREIPEAMKPRQIEISTDMALPKAETKLVQELKSSGLLRLPGYLIEVVVRFGVLKREAHDSRALTYGMSSSWCDAWR